MKVSIIIPVYNVDKYLKQCIESIINQSFKDFEAIFIDDDSTDNSLDILKPYQTDKRIVVLHKKNEGAGLARNEGLKGAKGKYITFVDPDDYVEIDYLLELVSEIEEGYDIVLQGHKEVLDDGTLHREYKLDNQIIINGKAELLPKTLGSCPEKSDNIGTNCWSRIYRKDIINKYNIRFMSERIIGSEDLFFNFDYLSHIGKSKISSANNYNQRIRVGSLSRKYVSNRFETYKALYQELLNRIEKNNLDKECIYRAMRGFFVNWKICLAQEKRSISNKSFKDEYKSIKNICNDGLVEDVLNEYPLDRIGFKQRIFLYLVKYKFILIIMLFIDFGIFK